MLSAHCNQRRISLTLRPSGDQTHSLEIGGIDFNRGADFAPLREMGFLIQAAVLAKAQRPQRRNAHYYGAIQYSKTISPRHYSLCSRHSATRVAATASGALI
jgi:hypothetical protein